jgi:Undecaprenyl-phosphate glucose phosphotransferase
MRMNIRSHTEFVERKPPRTWLVGFEDLGALIGASDVLAVLFASLAAGIGYHLNAYDNVGRVEEFAAVGALIAAILVPILHVRGAYDPATFIDGEPVQRDILVLWLGVLMFVIGVSFAFKTSELFSRGYVFTLCVAGPVSISVLRIVLHRLVKAALARGALKGRKIVLVVEENAAFGQQRASYVRHGYTIARAIQMPAGVNLSESAAEWRRRGDEIADLVRGSDTDEVHIAVDWNRWSAVKEVLGALQRVPVPVRLLADPIARDIMRYPQLRSASGYAFELQRAPLTLPERFVKRALDIVLASIALVALLPLLFATACAVRLDSPGPILFRQTRKGFNGRPFRIFKFRTMTVIEDGSVVVQARRNDSRVTRVGRWLRRSSMDELPQLLNVLRGDMSLVGPRPHALAHDDQYTKLIANYACRHHVRPGITGWAQVHGFRGETASTDAMRRRVELDIQYITNWSLLLDLHILLRTVIELLRPRNAY